MEEQEGSQQPHLALAHKLFLLAHPDVDDIDKVRLRDEVFLAVKDHGNVRLPFLQFCPFPLPDLPILLLTGSSCVETLDMASLYESLAARSVLEMDAGVLDSMRRKIEDELKKLDEK